MFSTEIIINSLLYALNQSSTSHIDVLGTEDSTKDLYLQIKELCNNWGVSDAMLRNCWQFESDVWDGCVRMFECSHFEFSSSQGTIVVTIYPGDMVFIHTADFSIKDIEEDTELQFFGTKYFNYALDDGANDFACFSGFENKPLNEIERYELLYWIAHRTSTADAAVAFIKDLIWSDLLHSMHGCAADAVGNMPCDNGVLCDRCHDDATMRAAYPAVLYELGIDK